MRKQDKNLHDDAFSFEKKEGQRMYLSCNKASSRCPSLGSSGLTPESLQQLEGLGIVLRRIHRRLKNEGYDVIDGVLVMTNLHEKKHNK